MGADLALRMYERYVKTCQSHNLSPLLLESIQGDIKPLVSHLQFQSRFRRPDLTPVIDQFHQRRSRLAPLSTTEYRPREANFVADYLAGQGSAYLLQRRRSQAHLPAAPEYLDIAPPYELLLKKHASIAGPHAGGKLVLALIELPGCTLDDLACVMQALDPRVQRHLCQIVLATLKCTQPMVVEYVTSSTDGQGRVYARQAGAQQLSRDVRTLVYGNTRKEVDMSGAHYEILRRMVKSSTLPPIHTLREQLGRLWHESENEETEEEIKRFPIRVINAGVPATLQRALSKGLVISPEIEAISYELAAARDAVTAEVLTQFRPDLLCTGANKHFFALEYVESRFMPAFLRELKKRDRCASIIWLHDGLWVQRELCNCLIFTAEQIAAQEVFPTCQEWPSLLRIECLQSKYAALRQALPRVHRGHIFPPPLTCMALASLQDIPNLGLLKDS